MIYYNVGDVIRCDRLTIGGDEECRAARRRYPLYGIVTHGGSGGVNVSWLNEDSDHMVSSLNHHNRFRIAPPEEWPDEICAKIAAWRLCHDQA